MPFAAWYPWDWKVSPFYELTYFLQFVANFLMIFPYCNADMFFSSIMILTANQFEILGT